MPNSVLIAVSGGLDSMCMLHYLRHSYKTIYAAYVNHGIRNDTNEDSNLIKRKCKEYGIAFYELFIDPTIFAGSKNGGFESIARAARYKLLFELKAKLKLNFLATAHHKNDQAETVFLRIARGTGIKGLRGILAEREDSVIRPMLNFTKQNLFEYAKQNNIEWREDYTNASYKYFRNKVRLQILPKIENNAPSTINSLANIAELSQKIYPKVIKVLNSYFNPFLLTPLEWIKAPKANTKKALLLKYFYLPAMQGYGELFKIWLASKGITWEETCEAQKFYEKLQKKDSFRFSFGKAYFERKKKYLWCGLTD